jgi:signal transduction histidine kinase/ligand-binding sensor domain-containing protein
MMATVRAAANHRFYSLDGLNLHVRWLLILVAAPSLFALNPNLSLGQYLHTSWTQEEGSALPPTYAVAQTADGYLWLGTGNGLFRFDGMRLTEWSPTAGPALLNLHIGWLRAASGGGLWGGTASGLWRVDRGRLIGYPALGKLPCPVIVSILEDRSRGVWLLNVCPAVRTLALLSPDGGLQTFGIHDGLPGQPLRALFHDTQGGLLLVTTAAVCHWSPGHTAVCSKAPTRDLRSIAEIGNGELLMADGEKNQIFRFSNGQAEPAGPHIQDATFSEAILYDRDGNIWIGTMGQGLLRIRQNRVDRFTRTDGLSNNVVTALTEDKEGDIWAATARGIDRIRDPKLQLYSTQSGLSSDLVSSVYAARDGGIWIGTAGGMNRLAGEQLTVHSSSAGLPSPMVNSSYEDPFGKLWVATNGGLVFLHGDRFVEVLTRSGQHLLHVYNIAGDPSGTVWLADSNLGLFTVRGGVAHPVTVPALDTGDIVALSVPRAGEVWLGHQHGGITVLGEDSSKHYDSREGLGNGPVRALYTDRHGTVWAGTSDGLSRFRDSRWTTWTAAQGLPDGGVQGIVADDTGGLWLLTPAGVLRLPLTSLEGPAKSLQFTPYGWTEGVRLGNGMTNPRLTRSRDGRIWVCTEDGVAAIDPARMKKNPVPPPVAIEQVIADGKVYDPWLRGETAFRGHDLQIVYTGISLMAPEQVRFRYRLDGLDRQWTDAGTRRNVSYVNLPPRHYRFQVIACNNDGLWNNAGADFALRVDPYFYQTKWFAVLCLTAVTLLVWSAHRLKVRRVVSRLQLIAAERVRFGRELHDSLLQGFSGVVFLLEAAARQFETAPLAAKQRLERAIDQADRSLREARQMIVSMRIPALENNTLPEALQTTALEMVADTSVDVQFEIKGRPEQGPYNVEANLFLIAREAVTNALKHASAKRIRLELCYKPKELHLTIQDDGVGFEPGEAAAKAGHFGLHNMQERARLLRGWFSVRSAPGKGTTIEVTVGWKK